MGYDILECIEQLFHHVSTYRIFINYLISFQKLLKFFLHYIIYRYTESTI